MTCSACTHYLGDVQAASWCRHTAGDIELASLIAQAVSDLTPEETRRKFPLPDGEEAWFPWIDDAGCIRIDLEHHDLPLEPLEITLATLNSDTIHMADRHEAVAVINGALFVWGESREIPSTPELICFEPANQEVK